MASPNIILLVLLISSSIFPLSIHCKGGFTIELIHRDSPKSPFYNPSLSPSDRLRMAVHRSIARSNYFLKKSSKITISTAATTIITTTNDDFNSEVISKGFEYLMSINVGTPPFNILAIADTGSDLSWTQCKPCIQCYKQDAPIFDPKASTTYKQLSCESTSCSKLPQGGCGTGSTCEYEYSYGDGSITQGTLSSETFTFDSEGKRNVSIPKVLFGCSHLSNGTFDGNGAGIVGLGGGPLSLVSQLGPSINNKFSYCLVSHSDSNNDSSNASSLLNFGDKANVGPDAVTTPLITGEIDTFYYLSLETISVGEDTVAYSTPKASKGEGNIIIDSGTTLTMLDDSMLSPLVDKLSKIVNYSKVNDPDNTFDLCFDVSGSTDNDLNLPELTFGFSGASVKLPPTNAFLLVKEGVVCLAMVPANGLTGQPIFGNIAQQNLHIGYDLGARQLSIAPADCANLKIS